MPLLFVHGDITKLSVDAIVNAANPWLAGGGGVDGAIHRAAGPRLHEACVALGGCAVGEAKITDGFNLPCRYIIHTPGPVWHGGGSGEAQLLSNCYTNSLRLALEHDCESVAFPQISTGAYGYPKEEALQVATDAINAFLTEHDMTVTIVIFDGETLGLRARLLREISELIGPDNPSMLSDALYTSNIRSESAPMIREDRIMESESPRKARKFFNPRKGSAKECAAVCSETMLGSAMPGDLDDFLKQEDEGFRGMLIRKIGEKGWTDAQCYRKANIDRRLFNHIINDKVHNPKKKTVFAFILALELNDEEAHEMLRKAGYAFAPSVTDKIIQWCINSHEYDITKANEILFEYDQELLC